MILDLSFSPCQRFTSCYALSSDVRTSAQRAFDDLESAIASLREILDYRADMNAKHKRRKKPEWEDGDREVIGHITQ